MTKRRIAALAAAVVAVVAAGAAGAGLMHRVAAPGGSTRITVHGEWTIVVRNKAHKIVARRHFENALTPSGASYLSALLARQYSAGSWGVNIGFGAIVDSNNTASDTPPFYKNLQVTAPTSGGDAGKLVLSGTATPSSDTSISTVTSYVGTCSGTDGLNCIGPASTQFTSKALTPVAVLAGQQVAVTVKISWS